MHIIQLIKPAIGKVSLRIIFCGYLNKTDPFNLPHAGQIWKQIKLIATDLYLEFVIYCVILSGQIRSDISASFAWRVSNLIVIHKSPILSDYFGRYYLTWSSNKVVTSISCRFPTLHACKKRQLCMITDKNTTAGFLRAR